MFLGLLFASFLALQQAPPAADPVPAPQPWSLADFQTRLGECAVMQIEAQKTSTYVNTLTAKIRELQAELDKLKPAK